MKRRWQSPLSNSRCCRTVGFSFRRSAARREVSSRSDPKAEVLTQKPRFWRAAAGGPGRALLLRAGPNLPCQSSLAPPSGAPEWLRRRRPAPSLPLPFKRDGDRLQRAALPAHASAPYLALPRLPIGSEGCPSRLVTRYAAWRTPPPRKLRLFILNSALEGKNNFKMAAARITMGSRGLGPARAWERRPPGRAAPGGSGAGSGRAPERGGQRLPGRAEAEEGGAERHRPRGRRRKWGGGERSGRRAGPGGGTGAGASPVGSAGKARRRGEERRRPGKARGVGGGEPPPSLAMVGAGVRSR